MPYELPLPDDWQHLIEKRQGDRRKSDSSAPKQDQGKTQTDPPHQDRRSGLDRRRD